MLEGQLSLFKYKNTIKKALKDLKYGFVTDIVSELAEIMAENIKKNYPHLLSYWQENNFVIIPVPLHYYRFNWRGYNQSELLGEVLANDLTLSFSKDIIIRFIDSKPQASLKRKKDRFSNVKQIFRLNNNQEKPPQNIIIFDDVYTTGSTINSVCQSINPSPLNHCWTLTVAG